MSSFQSKLIIYLTNNNNCHNIQTMITDTELAKKTGIPKPTLSNWKVTNKDNWRYALYNFLKFIHSENKEDSHNEKLS